MENTEIWKDIPDYPNYQISNFGRVKSLNYKCSGKERILKLGKSKNGYLKVAFWRDGKGKTFTVHQLVANVFLKNDNNLPQINHKDENKENNHVDNLEFCDIRYNNCYGSRIERMSKANRKPILQFTKEGVFIKEWDSVKSASKELNIKHISECCKGKRKTSGNFIWKYKYPTNN